MPILIASLAWAEARRHLYHVKLPWEGDARKWKLIHGWAVFNLRTKSILLSRIPKLEEDRWLCRTLPTEMLGLGESPLTCAGVTPGASFRKHLVSWAALQAGANVNVYESQQQPQSIPRNHAQAWKCPCILEPASDDPGMAVGQTTRKTGPAKEHSEACIGTRQPLALATNGRKLQQSPAKPKDLLRKSDVGLRQFRI